MRPMFLTLCALLAASCTHTGSATRESGDGVSDTQIGLSKTRITEIPDPLAFRFVDSDPGDAPLPERAFSGTPPVIPHALAGMLPLTRSENQCLDCHEVEAKEPGEPTPIPESHYVDLRHAPGVKREAVAGARYNCILCHAPQTDAGPLVESNFSR